MKNEKKILSYPIETDDSNMIVSEAVTGVYASSFFDFAEASGHPKEKLADILNISVKTLMRYKTSKSKMNPQNSEHLIKLFALYRKGINVLGSIASFNNWLQKPAFGLGGIIPFSYLNTISGIDIIIEELSRIEHGDLS
jgi:putative toxin-antitoxin system antitoxin component (TIGR02293 family)